MSEQQPISSPMSRTMKEVTSEVRNLAGFVIVVHEDRARLVYRNHRDRRNEWAKVAFAFSTFLSLLSFWLAGEPKSTPPILPTELWRGLWWIALAASLVLAVLFLYRAVFTAKGEDEFVEALKHWTPSETETTATTGSTNERET